MATETVGFTTREARDDEYRRLKAESKKGVCKYTDQKDKKMVYVVAYSADAPVTVVQS